METEGGRAGRQVDTQCLQEVSVLVSRSGHLASSGLGPLMREKWGLQVVCDATHPDEAVLAARARFPDLILVAGAPAGRTLPALLAELHSASPASRILVLGGEVDGQCLPEFWGLGVRGYVLWDQLTEEKLRSCLEAVVEQGVSVLDDAVVERLVGPAGPQQDGNEARLTDFERAVYRGLKAGLSGRQIAREKGVSERKIQRAAARIREKLDASTNCEAIAKGSQ